MSRAFPHKIAPPLLSALLSLRWVVWCASGLIHIHDGSEVATLDGEYRDFEALEKGGYEVDA